MNKRTLRRRIAEVVKLIARLRLVLVLTGQPDGGDVAVDAVGGDGLLALGLWSRYVAVVYPT